MLSALLDREPRERTNVVVEERAALAWLSKAFRAELASVRQRELHSDERHASPSPSSSRSSSVASDDAEDTRTTAAVTQKPKPLTSMDDDYQRLVLAQREWQSFEDKARELRRLVDGQHDPDAVHKLQHLRKPKTSRLKRSDLPTWMVAHRYLRAELSTKDGSPAQWEEGEATAAATNVSTPTPKEIALTRESAARQRRMQHLHQQSLSPERNGNRTEVSSEASGGGTAGATSANKEEYYGLPPPLVPEGRPSRATKLPSLAPLKALPHDKVPHAPPVAASSHLAVAHDDTAAASSTSAPRAEPAAPATASEVEAVQRSPPRTKETTTAVQPAGLQEFHGAPMQLSSEDASPERHAEALSLAGLVVRQAAAILESEEREHAAMLLRHKEAERRECRHLEETERHVRTDIHDDEGECRRTILREALMDHTSITRREREQAVAEREHVYRKELERAEGRRTLYREEDAARKLVEAEEKSAVYALDLAHVEVRETHGREEEATFEDLQRSNIRAIEHSERQLSSRLGEERRVREEAERRVRMVAERRAREERERMYTDKLRLDIKEQIAFLASEVERRHGVEREENEGYIRLLMHQAFIRDEVARIRERQLRAETEAAIERQRVAEQKRMAKEQADRRDLGLEECSAREMLAKQANEAYDTLAAAQSTQRIESLAAEYRRRLHDVVIGETRARSALEVDEEASVSRLQGSERAAAMVVLETVKVRETEEARRAYKEAERLLQEALEAKQQATERLRLETERIEQERIDRRARDIAQQLMAQFSLLENQAELHRELIVASEQADWETLCSRESTNLEVIRTRLETAARWNTDVRAHRERLRAEEEAAEQVRQKSSHAAANVARAASPTRSASPSSETAAPVATVAETTTASVVFDNTATASPRSEVAQRTAEHRYVELQIAAHFAEVELEQKRREDERLQEARRREIFAAALEGVIDEQETAFVATVHSDEQRAFRKLVAMWEISWRSAVDRMKLRELEAEADKEREEEGTSGGRAVGQVPVGSPVLSQLLRDDAECRLALANEAVRDFSGIVDRFRAAVQAARTEEVFQQKERVASGHEELTLLLADERRKQADEHAAAILTALFALSKSETEGRAMLSESEGVVRAKIKGREENAFVIVSSIDKQRQAEQREAKRKESAQKELQEQRMQEVLLFFAKQEATLVKDEVLHRQVIELAEQADFDNAASRALHSRVLIETKQAARLRQQERDLEEQAVILARIHLLCDQLLADESHRRAHITSEEFSYRRLLDESITASELRARGREVERVAWEMQKEDAQRIAKLRETSGVLSPWDAALREKEAALLRARTEMREREASHQAEDERWMRKLGSTSPLVPAPATTPSAEERPPSRPFSVQDMGDLCGSLDDHATALFVKEEAFLRATLAASQQTIRRDILREERYMRKLRLSAAKRGGATLSLSPARDRAEVAPVVILVHELAALCEKESYLRQAIAVAEHEFVVKLLNDARTMLIVRVDNEPSPVRRRLEAVAASDPHKKWLRTSMEVVFQEEFHRREQIIAEYNRANLENLMQPFERDLAFIQLGGEEIAARRVIESDEAVVVTKLLKRWKRMLRTTEMLEENSRAARNAVLDDFIAIISSLSISDLALLSAAKSAQTPIPVGSAARNYPRAMVGSHLDDVAGHSGPPHPPSSSLTFVFRVPTDVSDGWNSRPTSPPDVIGPGAPDENLLQRQQARATTLATMALLRDALVTTEIEQVHGRKRLSEQALTHLALLHAMARHFLDLLLLGTAALRSLADNFARRTGALRAQSDADIVNARVQRFHTNLKDHQAAEVEARSVVGFTEATQRNLLVRFRQLEAERVAAFQKMRRTVDVLFEAVRFERFSAALQVQLRTIERSMNALVAAEVQQRQSIEAEAADAGKQVRREIVAMMEMKQRIDVDMLKQRKQLLLEEEDAMRAQMEWSVDLLMRLTARFLKLQFAIERAATEYSNQKQSWCMEQILGLQKQMLAFSRQQKVHLEMALVAVVNTEAQLRILLLDEEEIQWKYYSRYDRFVSALDAFIEKCLAAKIALVERFVGPGLPPPPSVSIARLPRLKSVLQRSQSLAVVVNHALGSSATLTTSPSPLHALPSASPIASSGPSPVAFYTGSRFNGENSLFGSGQLHGSSSFKIQQVQSFRISDAEDGPLSQFYADKSQSFLSAPSFVQRRVSGGRSPSIAFVEPTAGSRMVSDADILQSLPPNMHEAAILARDNDPALSVLDLASFPNLTVDHVQLFADIVAGNSNLTLVDLHSVKMDVRWMTPVARLANRVGSIDLTDTDMDDEMIAELFNKFSTVEFGNNVRSVLLDRNTKLSSTAPSQVARAARMTHSVLERVSLSGVPALTSTHQKWLAFYLDLNKEHKQFKTVILAVEGRQAIPRLNFCIPRSKTSSANLKGAENMFRREFDDRSVRLLCIAVASNPSVESVSFRGNRITDRGAKLLAMLLQRNTTLRELDLSYNEITNEGAAEFEQVLATTNKTLIGLDLTDNTGISNLGIMQRIADYITRNIGLRQQ